MKAVVLFLYNVGILRNNSRNERRKILLGSDVY